VAKKSEKTVMVPEAEESQKSNLIATIRTRLEKEIGERRGLEAIYYDSSWDGFLAQATRVGAFFNAGKLKLGYIDKGESNDFIVVPGKETTVISVSPKCPRDRIIKVISGHIVSSQQENP